MRKGVMEKLYIGFYWNFYEIGVYWCFDCGKLFFSSCDKFDFGIGWFSFIQFIGFGVVICKVDLLFGMECMEVKCVCCDVYLGYVFDDGLEFIGKRFCMNFLVLWFEK